MKMLGRIIVGILVCVVLVVVVLRITGLDPKARNRPGLWLTGSVATAPVADWSFTDKIPTVKVQTQTWYLLPHSVIVDCNVYNGNLYLISVYPAGPQRFWNRNVARDPHVRIKIGDQLYDPTLFDVTDPVEKAGALESRAKKYPQLRVPPNPIIHVFRVIG